MAYIYPTHVHGVSDSFRDHVRRGSPNCGTDYVDAYGDACHAVATGTVTDADSNNDGGGGRTIHINHDDGTGADYLHLSQVLVKRGQRVAQGALIGKTGASGYGKDWYYGPHLHISFRPNHSRGYGNNGNQDFDAIMRSQGVAPPPAPAAQNGDEEMKIISVPGGTIALVGEYTGRVYTTTAGGQGFSIGSNTKAYGSSGGMTPDEVTTVVNEANARRSQLITDVTNQVMAAMSKAFAEAGKAGGVQAHEVEADDGDETIE